MGSCYLVLDARIAWPSFAFSSITMEMLHGVGEGGGHSFPQFLLLSASPRGPHRQQRRSWLKIYRGHSQYVEHELSAFESSILSTLLLCLLYLLLDVTSFGQSI